MPCRLNSPPNHTALRRYHGNLQVRLTPFDARRPPLAQGRITWPSVPPAARGSAPAAGATEASQPPVEWKSPIVKFFNDAEKAALTAKLKIEEGDLILFAADQWLTACEILGKIRLYCADVLKTQGKLTIPADQFNFLWVIEFPLLGFDREQNRWYSSHHPFTAPVTDDIPLLKSDPKKVRGQHYDIVVNGVELGGGSIRIHQPDVQKTIFEELLQIPPDLVKARFGYMLEAFKYGAPPHGGIALGFDRLIAILCNTPSIRDVIAFPKTAKGTCLMTDSPSTVEPKQLRDLHIELKVKQPMPPPPPKA